MDFNLQTALNELGPNAGVRLFNAARPPASYLFNTFLPERAMSTYYIDAAHMTVRTTMAGLVAMDSPYPPGGYMEMAKFLAESAKMGMEAYMPEGTLRIFQDILMRLAMTESPATVNQRGALEILNFFNKVVVQGHMDRAEWLRAQALVYGRIDWTFNKKNLLVDYGVPAANFITARTGNDAYHGSTSKFWTDIYAARRILKNRMRVIVAHPNTVEALIYNTANSIQLMSESTAGVRIVRLVDRGGAIYTPSADARDVVTIVSYDLEGEILDPANPGATKTMPFMPEGKLLILGEAGPSGYRIGFGSANEDPQESMELGYYHIAPTVEGGGAPGRWGEIYVPQDQPWQLRLRAAENSLPVITAPEKIVVLTTEMPA